MRSVKPLSLFVTGQFDSDSERYWPLIPTTRQTVASFRRILWPAWLGFRGQLPSDSVASFRRILHRDLVKVLPTFSGRVLDVGCGHSPYRHMLSAECDYVGIDVAEASEFDYHNPNVTYFNGTDIPYEDCSFDAVICTEVLEHVYEVDRLVAEMHRVMKPGAHAIITIPWSARFHYIPHDYFRYTPSALKAIFRCFSDVSISARGDDVAVIANKLIVLTVSSLHSFNWMSIVTLPMALCLLPICVVWLLLAHLSLWFRLGSDVDPLGYTVRVRK